MPNLFEETRSSILFRENTPEQLLERLDSVHLDAKEMLQFCVLVSRRPVSEILRGIAEKQAYGKTNEPTYRIECPEFSSEPVDRVATRFKLIRNSGNRHEQVAGEFLVSPTVQQNVSLIVFIEPTRFWQRALKPFIERLHPKLVRPFFTQRELHNFLQSVQAATRPYRVRVLKLSSRERLAAKGARRKFGSAVRWTDTDLESLFQNARFANVWFRGLSFELVSEKQGKLSSVGVNAKISKDGYFGTTANFSLFYKTVISPMIELAKSRFDFLSDRDRRATVLRQPRPLKISYDSEVFQTLDQTKKFLEIIKGFKHGTCSVLHGNPYLHVSLVDNYDYSSADVWVLNKTEVLIVPQIKTSEAALKRMVNHIFENFNEGSLIEYEGAKAAV